MTTFSLLCAVFGICFIAIGLALIVHDRAVPVWPQDEETDR